MPPPKPPARLSAETFSAAGRLLVGADDWKRPLARTLGARHPDGPKETIDLRLPARWARGEKPIAGWVGPVIAALLAERADALEEDARRARDLAAEITDQLADRGAAP